MYAQGVTKSKLLSPMHSEAKQTKTSEYGAEKVYCRAIEGD